jgi:CRISPR-associated exonuclease Cas4
VYIEDDLIPLSALQHLLFCERQCALIHVEQAWSDNLFTAEGKIMHNRVHEADRRSRGNIRVEYGMPLRSLRLGLIGKADVVEFHLPAEVSHTGLPKRWQPFPVEYKRGKPKADNCDKVQLCAQALCLEEMLAIQIPRGALFYGRIRRRRDVDFDDALRQETESAARRLHALVESGRTPLPVYSSRCKRCSLFNICLPRTVEKRHSVKQYLSRALQDS